MLKVIGFLVMVSMTLATLRPDSSWPGADPFGPSRPWSPGTVFHAEEGRGITSSTSSESPGRIHPASLEEQGPGVAEESLSLPITDVALNSPPESSTAVTTIAPVATVATPEDDAPVLFKQRNLSGPRIGMTAVLDQDQIDKMKARGMGPFMSQFGWHFERRMVPLGGGPQFVIESVPMVGGVEYGEFIPSMTLAMGVRFPSGAEFGLGPSISANPDNGGSSSLVIAAGRSFDYGGVSLPVNVALSTNPHGQRLSLVLGYAIQQR